MTALLRFSTPRQLQILGQERTLGRNLNEVRFWEGCIGPPTTDYGAHCRLAAYAKPRTSTGLSAGWIIWGHITYNLGTQYFIRAQPLPAHV